VDLYQRIAAISAIAERRGGSISADVREPARRRQIVACEEIIALALPPSLRSFLEQHDGLTIRVYSGQDESERFEQFSLEVRRTADIAAHTQQFRDFHAELGGYPPQPAAYASQYIDAVDLGNPDRRLLIDTADRVGAMECPLIEISLIGWPTEQPEVVAESFGDFIDRALEFMSRTEGGFSYWEDPFTDW
jgi:DNA-binding transcriptional LysR family regulator